MTKRDIAILTVRVFAGFLVYQAISSTYEVASGIWQIFEDYGENRHPLFKMVVFLSTFLPFSLNLAAGAAIWKRAPQFATHLLKGMDGDPDDKTAIPVKIQSFEKVVCSLFGIYVVIHALPRFIFTMSVVYQALGTPAESVLASVTVRAQVIESFSSMLMGIILIASGPTVLRFIGRARYLIHQGHK